MDASQTIWQRLAQEQYQVEQLRAAADKLGESKAVKLMQMCTWRDAATETELVRLMSQISMYSRFLAKETQLNDFLLQDFDNLQKIIYKLQFEDQQKQFLKNAQSAISYYQVLARKKICEPCLHVKQLKEDEKHVNAIIEQGKQIIIKHRREDEERLLTYQNYVKKTTKIKALNDQNGEVIEPEKEIVTWLKAQDLRCEEYAEIVRQAVVQTLANLQNMQKMQKNSEFIRLPKYSFE